MDVNSALWMGREQEVLKMLFSSKDRYTRRHYLAWVYTI